MIILAGRMGGGYFMAAVILDHGVVVEAAPVLRPMLGWREEVVRNYALRKGWKLWLKNGSTN